MGYTRDASGNYRFGKKVSEEDILHAAEEILTLRFQKGDEVSDPSEAGRILRMRLAHLPHEVFCVIFLDTRHRILSIEDLFHGTIDGCEVHPRVIAKRALELNAAAVILGHQHPSGNPTPSAADRAVTVQIKQALALLDIRVLDHFVIGGNHPPRSLAARGWI